MDYCIAGFRCVEGSGKPSVVPAHPISANSVCISYFYFVYCIISVCFLLCMFLLYITVLLPVSVIKDDDNKIP